MTIIELKLFHYQDKALKHRLAFLFDPYVVFI